MLSSLTTEMPPPYTAVESESDSTKVTEASRGSSPGNVTQAPEEGDTNTMMDLGSSAVLMSESQSLSLPPPMDRAHSLVLGYDEVQPKTSRNRPAPLASSNFASIVPSFLSRKSYVSAVEAKKVAETRSDAVEIEPLPTAFMVLLHSLRLFATVPGIIGTVLSFWHGVLEAQNRHWLRSRLQTLRPCALEYFICCFWSLCTAFHALSLMTLLLRRWLIYYAVLPSVIRLIAFQSICWTLVRLSLYLFGPQQPVGGWVLVSSFTAFVDIVARWITSNITDVDETEHELQGVSDYPDTCASDGEGLLSAGECSTPGLPSMSSVNNRRRYQRYRERSARLFRVLVGGPTDEENIMSDTDPSETESKSEQSVQRNELRRRRLLDPNAPATDSDASSSTSYPTIDPEVWRRRVDARHSRARQSRTERHRKRRKAKQSQISSFFQNYRAARIHSRRVFHWEVAMWRNVMPIAVLGYLTLWALLLAWSWRMNFIDLASSP